MTRCGANNLIRVCRFSNTALLFLSLFRPPHQSTVTAAWEVMLNNKLTSSLGDSLTSKSHNCLEHIKDDRQCEIHAASCMSAVSRRCVDLLTAVHRSSSRRRRPHLSVQEQAHRPGDDGGLCRLSSANRLDYRDIGQFCGGGDL